MFSRRAFSFMCLLVMTASLFLSSSRALALSSPALYVTPTILTGKSSQCQATGIDPITYQCTVTLGESQLSSGSIKWTSSSTLSGVTFSPASGTLNPGGSTFVTINHIPSASGSFTFSGQSGVKPVSVAWSATPPTLSVSPTSLNKQSSTCFVTGSSYQCTASLGESATSQVNALWTASSTLSGVSFSPSGSILSPGQSTTVTISSIPCQNGTFTFSGNEGETPVSVAWSCTPPTLTVNPTSMNNGMCGGEENASQCMVTLGETSTSPGNVNWAATSDLSAASFSPANGTLSPGQTVTVTISAIPCQKGSFTFNGSGGASSVSVSWTCANWTQFGDDPQQTRFNPNEAGLSPSSVSGPPGLTLDWQSAVSTSNFSFPVVVNNLAYVGSADGYLVAVNVTSGAVVWKDSVASPTTPAEANGIVYIGSQDPVYGYEGLWAMDAQTGAVLWHNRSDFFGPPTVVNGVVYTVGATYLSAFDATSGALKWQYILPHGNGDSIAPAVANGLVYIGAAYYSIYAVDATTGVLKWSNQPNNYPMSGMAVANGVLYVLVSNSELVALDASSGTPLWSVGYLNRAGAGGSPAVANGVVYVMIGGAPDQLYAFDATSGAVLWHTAMSNGGGPSPIVANGVVYVASNDNNINAFDASTGRLLWSASIGGTGNPGAPVVVNGVLYIGGVNTTLYAFHLPGTTP